MVLGRNVDLYLKTHINYFYVKLITIFICHISNNTVNSYVLYTVFSSPELKAQVSFSDQFLSVVCPSVCLSVNFSHCHLLLKNHWANFNQIVTRLSFLILCIHDVIKVHRCINNAKKIYHYFVQWTLWFCGFVQTNFPISWYNRISLNQWEIMRMHNRSQKNELSFEEDTEEELTNQNSLPTDTKW